MTQKDYIIRHLEELQQIFAAIVKLKNEKNFEEACEVVSDSIKKVSGMKPQVIVAFSLDEILPMMEAMDENLPNNREKLVSISRLLFEHGQIDHLRGKEGASAVFYHKALSFMVYALKLGDAKPQKEEQKTLRDLVDALQGYEIHDEMRADIAQFLSES